MTKLDIRELTRLERILTDRGDCRRCGQPVTFNHSRAEWTHDSDDDTCGSAYPRGRDAPGSRYGTHVENYAKFSAAYAYALSSNGDATADDYLTDPDPHGGGPVALVVNDSAVPAETILSTLHLFSARVVNELGGLRELRALARD